MRIIRHLLVAALATAGCGSDDDDNTNAPRCAALCDEETCEGESREQCVDECVAQTEGLQTVCVQCLVEQSGLTARRELGGGEYCYPNADLGWVICDESGLNCRGAGDECDDEELPRTCSLRFGELSDCTEFCGG